MIHDRRTAPHRTAAVAGGHYIGLPEDLARFGVQGEYTPAERATHIVWDKRGKGFLVGGDTDVDLVAIDDGRLRNQGGNMRIDLRLPEQIARLLIHRHDPRPRAQLPALVTED